MADSEALDSYLRRLVIAAYFMNSLQVLDFLG
jgi:hypothetical protein